MPGPATSPRQLLLIQENRSAYRALERFLKTIGQSKPGLLFLYGPSGVGKSHLIAHALRDVSRKRPKLRWQSVTAAEFAARLAEASDAQTLAEFQESFRALDLLVCEDVQHLQRKRETQRQLIACLDALREQGALVILTSDTLPSGWKQVESRFADRCRGGLSVAVELPGTSSRQKLIEHFFEAQHLPATAEIVRQLADESAATPRELESLVQRLAQQRQLRRAPLTLELVEQLLRLEVPRPPVSASRIIKATARQFQLSVAALKSTDRRDDLVLARHCAMYLLKTVAGLSQTRIAELFGKADHTSALRAIRKIESRLESDSVLRARLADIQRALAE